ncbi:hypothetical protein [Cupriavidus sp. 2SB]|uniref:hypothetical protein n=1 Tax=Cupriavidus sp. 2SB TaxID=2502199 RepID=UPI0010F615C5|nr:hypothetical protein [Cupriavidus sp. 2SB]
MSDSANLWRMAPEPADPTGLTRLVEFAGGIYTQLTCIQREIGEVKASQQGLEARVERGERQLDAVEVGVRNDLREVEGRLAGQISTLDSRMSTFDTRLSTLDTRMSAGHAYLLDRIDASESRVLAAIEQLATRFDKFETRVDRMEVDLHTRIDATENKIEHVRTDLGRQIRESRGDLEIRIDRVATDLGDRIQKCEDKTEARCDRLEDNLSAQIKSNEGRILALRDRVNKVIWFTSGGGAMLGYAIGGDVVMDRLTRLLGL